MTERLNDRDWRLISAYLDARLSPAETARVENRLKQDQLFKQSLEEITYTKRLLASLPQKRAPRNFTLAAEKVRQPLRGLWLQPALSFVSIAAAVLLVVVYTFNTFGGGLARQAAAPQAEMFAAESDLAVETAPVIINWNPVLGMGGGDATSKEIYMGGDGIGGAGGPGFPVAVPGAGGGAPAEETAPVPPPDVEPEAPALAEPAPEAPAEPAPAGQAEEKAADSDLSTLILGLPQAQEAGTVIETAPLRTEPPAPQRRLSTTTIIMGIAGIIAILAGAGAIILRKILHA